MPGMRDLRFAVWEGVGFVKGVMLLVRLWSLGLGIWSFKRGVLDYPALY
jgi:hypothetical protein